jgi:hypothetical protein
MCFLGGAIYCSDQLGPTLALGEFVPRALLFSLAVELLKYVKLICISVLRFPEALVGEAVNVQASSVHSYVEE